MPNRESVAIESSQPMLPTRSYARANRELVESFDRYLSARGFSPATKLTYLKIVSRLADSVASESLASADRIAIRQYLRELCNRGLGANSIRRNTCALRSFFEFLRLSGVSGGGHDPTVAIPHRKLPRRLPRVLTIAEVERLISGARTPIERAVVQVLYSTGVRVSELVKIRLEDIDFSKPEPPWSIRIHKGKGGKDRVVLIGKFAASAIRELLDRHPSKTGLLFEAPARTGSVIRLGSGGTPVFYFRGKRKHRRGGSGGSWYARFYDDGKQRQIRLGSTSAFVTADDARREFERIRTGYHPLSERPYDPRAIRGILYRLAERARVGRVYPHALRRAFASHLLVGGADLRVVQELLGHERLSTTAIYVKLSAENLRKVYARCHPRGDEYAQG